MIESWTGNETIGFHQDPNLGVNARKRFEGPSLFAKDAAALKDFLR